MTVEIIMINFMICGKLEEKKLFFFHDVTDGLYFTYYSSMKMFAAMKQIKYLINK